MRRIRKPGSRQFQITDELEESYDATILVPEETEPGFSGPFSGTASPPLDADGGPDPWTRAEPELPVPRSTPPGGTTTRLQYLGLAAIIACPILTAIIGLASLSRSSFPDPIRVIDPARPLLRQGSRPRRHRGPYFPERPTREGRPAHAPKHVTPQTDTSDPSTAAADGAPVSPAPSRSTRTTAPPSSRAQRHRADPNAGGEFVLGGS